MKRILAGIALVGVVLVAWAGPASAHAQLETTAPAAGAVLAEPPSDVRLSFSEPVEISLGAVRVYDSNADRVDDGGARNDGGDTVVQPLGDLADGSYVVTWRVVSTDGHPVHGAFTFQVGDVATGDADALARRLLAADGGSEAVGVVFAVVRWAVFAALVLLVGAAGFCLVAWPEGLGLTRVRSLLWWAWGVAVAATVASVGAQGAYVGALGLGDIVDPDVVSSVLDVRYGRVALLRIALLVVAGVLLVATAGRGEPTGSGPTSGTTPGRGTGPGAAARSALGLLGAALVLTLGLSGHATAGDLVPIALLVDVVHVGAVALWLGGLVVVLAALLPRHDPDELALVVPRFSSIAFASVAALVVTGTFQSWRQVGGLEALTDTTYGHLLLVKLALFGVMVGFGYLGRRWVQRGYGPAAAAAREAGEPVDDDLVVAGYRRSIRVETGIGLAILAVTALLVNAQPARSALAQPYAAELSAGDELLVDLTIDPAKVGPAEIHVYTVEPTGAVADVTDLTMTLSLPERDVGPLEVPLQRAGPGHFSAYDVQLPLPGEWTVDIAALLDEFTEANATDSVRVRR